MDRFALVSDLHGNLTAWRAVLDDLRGQGVERIYCLGDLVGKGPDPVGVIDLVAERVTQTVRGNWDSAMLVPQLHEPLIDWQRDQLDGEHLRFLAGLRPALDLQVSGRWLRLFHASAVAETHRVSPRWASAQELHGMFANTEFTGFDHPEPDVVAYGDLHAHFMLDCGEGRKLVNVGSTGNPLDEPTAGYVLVHGVLGSAQPAGFGMEFRRCAYDIESEIAIAQGSGMPGVEPYVKELRTAVYRGAQS